MVIHNAILTGSILMQAPPVISGSLTLTGSLNATGPITGSGFFTAGTITAQTLVVQTVTSSVSSITGSTKFGSIIDNTHQFTGSLYITGSVGINAASSFRFNGVGDISHAVGYDSVVDGAFLRGQNGVRFITGTGGGTERMRISAAGTASFTANVLASAGDAATITLKQNSTTATSGIYLERSGEQKGYYIYMGGSVDSLTFQRNNAGTKADVMSLTRDGNVGIGTTSPQQKLHVEGDVYLANNRNLYFANSGVAAGAIRFYNSTSSATKSIIGSYLNIADEGNIEFANGASLTTKMVITSGGNVGIGTSTVTEGTQAAGSISIFPSSSVSSAPLIQFPGNGRIRPASTGDRLSIDGNSLFLNGTFGANIVMATGGGSVGIGTSSPTNALHLVNANHYQFKIQDSAASMLFGADDGIMIGIEMANSAGATWFIGPHDPGTTGIQDRLTIGRLSGTWSYPAKFSSGGNLTILGTLTQNASDIRLKDNIVNIPNALNKILSLNGFIFNWNELASSLGPYSTDTKQVGVSAQEIQSVLPEAVFLAPFDVDSFDDNKSKSGEKYLTVQYDKIIPLLIEGIKEQQAQIEELKALINK